MNSSAESLGLSINGGITQALGWLQGGNALTAGAVDTVISLGRGEGTWASAITRDDSNKVQVVGSLALGGYSSLRGLTSAGIAAERTVAANMADGPAFGGALYPPEKLQRLVGYLERRNVSVFGTDGNPGFMARADGTGQMLLPENPTVLQVKHELSHYLDFRNMGFEAYRDMGRVGRETSVLDRLQANRSWSTYTDAERQFSVDYVNRLKGQ